MFCEDTFTGEELIELEEIGELFFRAKTDFVCPDCYDDLRHLPLEEQLRALLQGSKYVWK
jgi:hypothetical protein